MSKVQFPDTSGLLGSSASSLAISPGSELVLVLAGGVNGGLFSPIFRPHLLGSKKPILIVSFPDIIFPLFLIYIKCFFTVKLRIICNCLQNLTFSLITF